MNRANGACKTVILWWERHGVWYNNQHYENLPTLHLKDEVELGDPGRTEKCLSILENQVKKRWTMTWRFGEIRFEQKGVL